MAPLDSTFGAMLIGVYCATFLQGLLTLQTYHYFDKYPKDPIFHKIIVFIVWSFDAIQLGLIAKSAYYYLVTQWGNQDALSTSIWEIDIQLTFIGLSTFGCQIFFLHRIWILSKRNVVLVACLCCLCLASLILEIVTTVRITTNRSLSEFGKKKAEIIGIFMFGAAADVLIALSLCYYLRRDGSAFQSTKSMVKRVIHFSLATGIVTSIFAIASIIAYFADQMAFYFIAIHFSLGRMYTNSLLATLNAREKLREIVQGGQTSSGSRRVTSSMGRDARARNSAAQYISPFKPVDKLNIGLHQFQPQPLSINYTVEQTTQHDIELSETVKKKDMI